MRFTKGQNIVSNINAIPKAPLIESDFEYRIFAIRAPENSVYMERLVVFAMPGETDARPEIAGQLVVYVVRPLKGVPDAIDWIEVGESHRRCGLGTRLWNAAERILGRKLDHAPVTKLGGKFARSFSGKCAGKGKA